MLEKYSLSVKLLVLGCSFIFVCQWFHYIWYIFETNGTKKNSKQNRPSSGTVFSQRFVKLFPAQLPGVPKWLFMIELHRSFPLITKWDICSCYNEQNYEIWASCKGVFVSMEACLFFMYLHSKLGYQIHSYMQLVL